MEVPTKETETEYEIKGKRRQQRHEKIYYKIYCTKWHGLNDGYLDWDWDKDKDKEGEKEKSNNRDETTAATETVATAFL